MTDHPRRATDDSRRRLLRAGAGAVAGLGLAGCLGSDDGTTDRPTTTDATTTGPATTSATPTPPADSGPWPTVRGGPRHRGRSDVAGPNEGSVAWTATLDAAVVTEPIVADGAVFVGTEAGELVALSVADGSVRWTAAVEDPKAPAYAGGSVLVADGDLRALDVRTGAEQWATSLDGTATSPPTVADGVAHVAVDDQSIAGVALRDATVAYATAPFTKLGGMTTPAVTPELVTVGATNGYYGLSHEGRRQWKRSVGGTVAGPPVVAGESTYVVTEGGTLLATKPGSGGVRWERSLPSGIGGTPVVADGVVSLVAGDDLFSLRASTGDDLWATPQSAQQTTAPVLAGDLLYVGNTAGVVLAVDRSNGITQWDAEVDGAVPNPPAVADGSLFVGTDAGSVFRLD